MSTEDTFVPKAVEEIYDLIFSGKIDFPPELQYLTEPHNTSRAVCLFPFEKQYLINKGKLHPSEPDSSNYRFTGSSVTDVRPGHICPMYAEVPMPGHPEHGQMVCRVQNIRPIVCRMSPLIPLRVKGANEHFNVIQVHTLNLPGLRDEAVLHFTKLWLTKVLVSMAEYMPKSWWDAWAIVHSMTPMSPVANATMNVNFNTAESEAEVVQRLRAQGKVPADPLTVQMPK